jgi:hypothetical protein
MDNLEELNSQIKDAIVSAYRSGHSETPYVSRELPPCEVLEMVDFDSIELKIKALEAENKRLSDASEWKPISEIPDGYARCDEKYATHWIGLNGYELMHNTAPSNKDIKYPWMMLTNWHEEDGNLQDMQCHIPTMRLLGAIPLRKLVPETIEVNGYEYIKGRKL